MNEALFMINILKQKTKRKELYSGLNSFYDS